MLGLCWHRDLQQMTVPAEDHLHVRVSQPLSDSCRMLTRGDLPRRWQCAADREAGP
jgi:hypothetical protein